MKESSCKKIIVVLIAIGLFLLIGFSSIAIISYQNTIIPKGIIIHHSAIPSPADSSVIDAKFIDEIHQRKGYGIFYWGKTYHIGYHYVILPDGTLQQGRPETLQGAHTLGNNDKIGICLIGEFTNNIQDNNIYEPKQPTPEQIKTLVELTTNLLNKYNLDKSEIYTHHQFNSETDCPGKNFPFAEFLNQIND
ncbi:MAG TPA: peptidoglycan recognition family protein [Pyrinomonadaceae bacterium]|nr:peptidoglycan recognition family protein [Pyrinomonadaceae bacterium]